jgi:hypothetical protein
MISVKASNSQAWQHRVYSISNQRNPQTNSVPATNPNSKIITNNKTNFRPPTNSQRTKTTGLTSIITQTI